MNFSSHYDAPVRLAALLVNRLTPGQAGGRPYDAGPGPEAATEALRSIEPDLSPLTTADADRLTRYAHTLRAVFTAAATEDFDAAADHVNTLLRQTRAQPRLTRHDGQPWHLHHYGTTADVAGRWAGTCATALGTVLGSDARRRLGVCTAPQCDRVYVDTSHNGSRRFCSTNCQNRVKTAAYRTRGR